MIFFNKWEGFETCIGVGIVKYEVGFYNLNTLYTWFEPPLVLKNQVKIN